MNPKAEKLYGETDKFVEKWSEIIYLSMMRISCFMVIVPFGVVSYFIYFTTDSGRESFHLPFLFWYFSLYFTFQFKTFYSISNLLHFFRFPLDWRHPIVYSVPLTLTALTTFYICVICGCFLMIVLGMWFYIIAFADDIYTELVELNIDIEMKANETELNRKFYSFIELHSNIRQLSQK